MTIKHFLKMYCRYKLEKSVYFTTTKFQKRKYWNLVNKKKIVNIENKTLKELETLFKQSVDKHLISDRKIGLFLSGGTDSTALAHILAKKLSNNFSTFTYGFKNDNKFSEINKAKITINNLKLIIPTLRSVKIISRIIWKKMISILESPFHIHPIIRYRGNL